MGERDFQLPKLPSDDEIAKLAQKVFYGESQTDVKGKIAEGQSEPKRDIRVPVARRITISYDLGSKEEPPKVFRDKRERAGKIEGLTREDFKRRQ